MFNTEVIYSLLLSIAKRHIAAPYLRLNTFAVIYDYSDFNTKNLGKTKHDADAGHYWTRSGVTFDEDCKDYGILYAQKAKGYMKDNKEYCNTIRIGVAFPEMCETCPESYRMTKEQAQEHSEMVLRAVIEELKSYQGYKVRADGSTFVTWSKEKVNGGCFIGSFADYMVNSQITINYDQIGVDVAMGAFASFDVCGCNIPKVEFGDDYSENKESATVLCQTC